MKIEKSLNDRIQTAYEQTFDLLYDEHGAKEQTGINKETENILWDFNEGIGCYVDRVLSGHMSINKSLKDHIGIIESWIKKIEKAISKHEMYKMRQKENVA